MNAKKTVLIHLPVEVASLRELEKMHKGSRWEAMSQAGHRFGYEVCL